jgi:hypothetical protein
MSFKPFLRETMQNGDIRPEILQDFSAKCPPDIGAQFEDSNTMKRLGLFGKQVGHVHHLPIYAVG